MNLAFINAGFVKLSLRQKKPNQIFPVYLLRCR